MSHSESWANAPSALPTRSVSSRLEELDHTHDCEIGAGTQNRQPCDLEAQGRNDKCAGGYLAQLLRLAGLSWWIDLDPPCWGRATVRPAVGHIYCHRSISPESLPPYE